MNTKTYLGLIALLGSLTALAPFSIDMYLPGFPAIAGDLHTTASKVSLTLSAFFVGISAGQLLYGPLLDKFGRKKPLYIGLLVYIVASIACVFASNIYQLIIFRLLQALGGCAAAVAPMAMVRDFFPVKDSAKVFSLLMLVVGTSPMIAPTLGGYITATFGWQAVFVILTGMGLSILLAVFFWLRSTYVPDKTVILKPGSLLRNFYNVLKNPQFYTYTFSGSISFSALFAYVSSAAVIMMQVFHQDQKVFGWIFAFLSIGFIGSSQLNNLLLKKFRSDQIIPIVLSVQVVFSVVFFLLSLAGSLNLPVTILFLFLVLSCVGINFPNASALALAPFSKNAGTASSLLGAVQMGAGALISVVISTFDKPSAVPLTAAMAVVSVAALLLLHFGKKNIVQSIEADAAVESAMLH